MEMHWENSYTTLVLMQHKHMFQSFFFLWACVKSWKRVPYLFDWKSRFFLERLKNTITLIFISLRKWKIIYIFFINILIYQRTFYCVFVKSHGKPFKLLKCEINFFSKEYLWSEKKNIKLNQIKLERNIHYLAFFF